VSLVIFVVVYLVIFSFGTLYVYRLLRTGPVASGAVTAANPKRPLAVTGTSSVPQVAQEGSWT
jgi:cytochrome d ubiquinol oxidase subunit I